jgi:hypothetical protein
MLHRTIASTRWLARIGIPVLAGLVAIGFAAEGQSQTRVYRCTNGAGETEFRQTPCAPSSDEEELTIDDRRSGWVPPSPRDDAVQRKGRRTGDKPGHGRNRATAAKQAERCWKKRRQLEAVNWRLRRGYKAGTGAKLRRRRDGYEAYIDRFCEGLGR